MRIDLLQFDDWCALYFDGKRVYQGHDLTAGSLMDILLKNKIFLEETDFKETWTGNELAKETYESGTAPLFFDRDQNK